MQLPPLPLASLRDHRSTADGLHLPLYRLSADKQQRLLYRDCRGRECFSAQRYRAAIDPANGRWRAGQHSLGVPGVRLLGLRHPEGWLGPGSRWNARRYLLAAADEVYLDPQQAALDHIAGR